MTDQMVQLIREAFGDAFSPKGVYDPRMDVILVLGRDCQYVQTMAVNGIAFLEDAHPRENEPNQIGFVISHATHFCKVNGSPIGEPVSLSKLFAALENSSSRSRIAIAQIAMSFPTEETLVAI